MPKKCAKMTKAGKRCGGYAQASSDYCFSHDPKTAAARKIARRAGGRNSRRSASRSPFPNCKVSTAKGLIAFVDALIHETWGMTESANRVRALSRLIQIQNELVTVRDEAKQRQGEEDQYWEDKAIQYDNSLPPFTPPSDPKHDPPPTA